MNQNKTKGEPKINKEVRRFIYGDNKFRYGPAYMQAIRYTDFIGRWKFLHKLPFISQEIIRLIWRLKERYVQYREHKHDFRQNTNGHEK